ncbi:hypothetical protein PS9374_04486 [Planomonospora sphaerica]|uniref:Secreted protein n=1 Tax=Planomonospora sphaerica TaxID=161355 RepID=A0A171DIX6_9ACTN|nr:hypothetical protein [Planomonospora sphaerica]GAT68821.1 hypothetical protein PS9374_04486 [Planomonospora sphaerica]
MTTPRRIGFALTLAATVAASLAFTAPAASASTASTSVTAAAANCGGYWGYVPANPATRTNGKITVHNSCGASTRARVGVYFSNGGLVYTTLCGGRSKTLSLPYSSPYYRSNSWPSRMYSEPAGTC